MDYDYLLKIVVIGNYLSGKTCLCKRFMNNSYSKQHIDTIGVDFFSKVKTIDNNGFQYKIKFQIWDTSGQNRFKPIMCNYLKNTTAIFIVFDLTKRSSLFSIEEWIDLANKNSVGPNITYLIGTKKDCTEKIDINEIEKIIIKYNLKYFKISSLTGNGIDFIFDSMARDVLDLIDKNIIEANAKNGIKKYNNTTLCDKQYSAAEVNQNTNNKSQCIIL